ncbi:MAG: NifB/NifX family molybdenum-iron cluster-binding protein [Bacteroidia bacterium]|nr:NifB/NifX family molybdenum-iron cluster-binding protein [Bacteroidia bacterium]
MKIAIPTRDGVVDHHFGHCDHYTIYEIDSNNQILSTTELASPEGCGCKSNIAYEMQEMGITLMLAGNIGQGAINKLGSCGIEVIKGCEGDVEQLVRAYLVGEVRDNPQVCDHHECHSHEVPTIKVDLSALK